jgi:hypothetical protein
MILVIHRALVTIAKGQKHSKCPLMGDGETKCAVTG